MNESPAPAATTPLPGTPRDGTPPRQRDAVALLFAALLGAVLAVYVATIDVQAGQPQHTDLRVFYASTRFLLQGQSIYTPVPTDYLPPRYVTWEGGYLHGNLNPPFQTVVMAPLGLLRYRAAFIVWSGLSLLSGAVAVWLVGRRLGYSRPRHTLGLWLVLLTHYGAWHNTASGQFGMVLLLPLVLGWLWVERDADLPAGVILGLALSVKLFVGAFVLVLAAQRRWRALLWLTATLVVCGGAAALVVGADAYREYVGILRSVEWLDDGRNASLAGYLHRVASALPWLRAVSSDTVSLAANLVAAGVLAITACRAGANRASGRGRRAGYVAAVPAMLLASPLGWIYYFPALVLPLLWLWRAAEGRHRTRRRVLLGAFWLLSAASVVTKDAALLSSTLPFLGLLGLWGLSIADLTPSPVRWPAPFVRRIASIAPGRDG